MHPLRIPFFSDANKVLWVFLGTAFCLPGLFALFIRLKFSALPYTILTALYLVSGIFISMRFPTSRAAFEYAAPDL